MPSVKSETVTDSACVERSAMGRHASVPIGAMLIVLKVVQVNQCICCLLLCWGHAKYSRMAAAITEGVVYAAAYCVMYRN